MQRTRNQRASHQQGFVRAADAGRWLSPLMMAITDDERSVKRLNRIAYANIGLGLFTFFVWAIRGPSYVPIFWQHIDQDFRGTSDPVAGTMGTVFKVAILLVVIGFWFLSVLSLTNGILILKRRRHRLCMILFWHLAFRNAVPFSRRYIIFGDAEQAFGAKRVSEQAPSMTCA
jgi:hypothetical protein